MAVDNADVENSENGKCNAVVIAPAGGAKRIWDSSVM